MIYDIIILGAGPAGLTAAIYALRANKKVLVLEKESIGGKISSSPLVENYPGFESISGSELTDKMYDQVTNFGGEVELSEVLSIKDGTIKEVITEDGTYKTRSIIVAVGSEYRVLGLPKEEKFIGNGISFCVACDGAFYHGKTVAVIGGGNSALINALSLSSICKKVYVVQNMDHFTGEGTLVNQLLSKDNVEVFYETKVTSYLGKDTLTGITIEDSEKHDLLVDGIFLSIGQIPSIDIVKDLLTLASGNYIKAGDDCTTNIKGIFVAGDCRSKEVRQLTTAVSDGTIAALKAIDYVKELGDV